MTLRVIEKRHLGNAAQRGATRRNAAQRGATRRTREASRTWRLLEIIEASFSLQRYQRVSLNETRSRHVYL